MSPLCQSLFLYLFLIEAGALEVNVDKDGSVNSANVDFVPECVDLKDECAFWADQNECAKNPGYMLIECMKSCNVCPDPNKAPPMCKNEDDRCDDWALQGECYANPSYMIISCPKACKSCHLLDADVRCRPKPGRTPAMMPGDLNETFARIISDYKHLEPQVLSTDPWVEIYHSFKCFALIILTFYLLKKQIVVFDNFLNEEEMEALKEGGASEGFTASKDAGKRLSSGKFEEIESKAR